jgi:hypothetical protein
LDMRSTPAESQAKVQLNIWQNDSAAPSALNS